MYSQPNSTASVQLGDRGDKKKNSHAHCAGRFLIATMYTQVDCQEVNSTLCNIYIYMYSKHFEHIFHLSSVVTEIIV